MELLGKERMGITHQQWLLEGKTWERWEEVLITAPVAGLGSNEAIGRVIRRGSWGARESGMLERGSRVTAQQHSPATVRQREVPSELFGNEECWLYLPLEQVPAQLCPAAHTGHTWGIPNTFPSCWCRNPSKPRCGATRQSTDTRTWIQHQARSSQTSSWNAAGKDTSKAWISLFWEHFLSWALKAPLSHCRSAHGL